MNIRSFLLSAGPAIGAITGAQAADAVLVAEPEPVEYVRVCEAYGAGFFYIPGTETCLKVSGYVRYDARGGDNVYKGDEFGTWQKTSRATMRFDARSETELGTLRSYAETRSVFANAVQSTGLSHAYIELGGFRIGETDSRFNTWTGAAGNVVADDVIDYAGDATNQISYTFVGGSGFSAMIGAEQGDSSHMIDGYMPHVVAGAKFEQGWGAVSAVGGYDVASEGFAGKVRLDVKFTDPVTAFVMAGYQSDPDKPNYYGAWNGDYALWGGLSAKISSKATMSGQVAYEQEGTFAAALNLAYEIVPGFVIMPEIEYTSFGGDRGNGHDHVVGGIVRFQRNF